MRTAPSATPVYRRASTADRAEAIARARRWLTFAGALSLLAGVVAIVVPNVASVATAIFIGWLLVFDSGLYVVDAFSTRDGTRMALRLLMAVLTFAAGVYLLVAPLDGKFTLTVILGMWFLAIGVARMVIGIAGRGTPRAGLLVVSGALSMALGLLIALQLPDSADWAIGLLVGIDLVFTGVVLLAFAQRLRLLTV
jgi:uncharacterized membrane protein HdeD (DUF308 family)